MLVQEGPVLNVKPFMRIYLKDETGKTFTITNSKSGTLTWEVGDPVYTGDEKGWITSRTPASGSTTTEGDEVTVTVSTVGLDPGIYRAKIPVTSNGGIKDVTVFLLVPFF
jgi:beta-lactam-binding protein with PASTA domain